MSRDRIIRRLGYYGPLDLRRVLAERLRSGHVHAADLYMLGRLQWIDPLVIEDVLGLQLMLQGPPWRTLKDIRREGCSNARLSLFMRDYLVSAWNADIQAEAQHGLEIPVERLRQRLRQLCDILQYLDSRCGDLISPQSRHRAAQGVLAYENAVKYLSLRISLTENLWDLWPRVQIDMTRRWAGGD